MDPLLRRSAVGLARAIKNGELTSAQVVDVHIARAIAVNPTLNAIVHDRYDAARRDALEAERAIAEGKQVGPLHGVPITIKDCVGIKGYRQTGGLVSRRHHLAEQDAASTARLRAAGAIPIGITNMSELGMWMETDNRLYGRTNNPYDPTHTVGGSSGGEGAIIGAGASPLGIGSDIGGSIRMPAFFNGVFGHKPSAGLVPNTGHWPMSQNEARRYLCTGPLCRSAEDLWPALSLIAGPDGTDEACEKLTLGDPRDVELSSLTVYDVASSGLFAPVPELVRSQRAVVEHLAARGARVERYQHRLFKQALPIWSTLMSKAAVTSFSDLLGDGTPLRFWPELKALVRGRSQHTLPALGLALAEKLAPLVPGAERAMETYAELKRDIDALLDERSLIVYPSYPEPAPRHHRALLPPLKWQYTAIWNVLETPVTQVPLGLSTAGLPLGVQLVGGHGKDHVPIAVALELEQRFGGWVPPPRL
jgi:fatty acid amide hydrolase 2